METGKEQDGAQSPRAEEEQAPLKALLSSQL
jgi:hypothetical protein